MSEEQKMLFGNMNYFFCGLHLLAGIANVCDGLLFKFENNRKTKDIGLTIGPKLKRYHKAESDTLRLQQHAAKNVL